MKEVKDISIIIPCLNEEKSISFCLDEIFDTVKKYGLSVEVIVVNNASTDRTSEIVEEYCKNNKDIILVEEKTIGYGNAYMRGFSVSSGKYIFMADGDGSYDFRQLNSFIDKLKEGNDMVIGNRFNKENQALPMPWLHRVIGNPFLSFLVRFFFKAKVRDIHCGMRAISKNALSKINLNTAGMEFASEMIIKAAKTKLSISEIDIIYRKRIGDSKLRTFRDGWRHLRFILLYSPLLLFLIPGLLIFALGFVGILLFYFSNPKILGLQFYIHPMFLFSVMMILGYQLVSFAGFAKVYAITHLGDSDKIVESLFKKITIEKVGFLGLLVAFLGMVIYLYIFIKWIYTDEGSLNETKNLIIALTALVLGTQTFFSAFMFSALGIKEK